MSNYRRLRRPGATVFFTVCLKERGSRLLIDEIDRLREAVRLTMAERPFEIRDWVVLPDHMHAIWTLPPDDSAYSLRWRLIKSRFSMGLPKGVLRPSHVTRQERGLWQRRFWEHHVRGAADYANLSAFCRADPVRHGLVSRPEDWPFSSVHKREPVG